MTAFWVTWGRLAHERVAKRIAVGTAGVCKGFANAAWGGVVRCAPRTLAPTTAMGMAPAYKASATAMSIGKALIAPPTRAQTTVMPGWAMAHVCKGGAIARMDGEGRRASTPHVH